MQELTSTDDQELFSLIRDGLSSAVIGDILDELNHRIQFLSPQVRPLGEDMM